MSEIGMLRQTTQRALRIDGVNDGDRPNREVCTWLYDGQGVHEVWIVKQNFDFYYDEGFEDAPEELNEEGEVFQVVVARDGKVKSVGLAFHSAEEAVAKPIRPSAGIEWDNHRLQPLSTAGDTTSLNDKYRRLNR